MRHEGVVRLLFYNDIAVVHHELTGEMRANFPGASSVLGLSFDRAGRGFLERKGEQPIWVSTVLQHHVFRDKEQPGGDDQLFVFTKTATGIDLQWLRDFPNAKAAVFPGRAPRAIRRQRGSFGVAMGP